VDVNEASAAFPGSNLSRDDDEDWKRMNRTLSSLDAYKGASFLWRTASGIEPVPGSRVSS
jgi:macrolide transport system ATP-binding/permease protein